MSGDTDTEPLQEKDLIVDTIPENYEVTEAVRGGGGGRREGGRGGARGRLLEDGAGRGGDGVGRGGDGVGRDGVGRGGDGVGRDGVGRGGDGVGRGGDGVGRDGVGRGGDGVGRDGVGRGGDGVGRGGGAVGGEEQKFDVAVLYNDECDEEGTLADQLISEMQNVKVNNQPIRVVDYYHPTFGGSIIETPRNLLSRCRFVLVLITEKPDAHGVLRYARNEVIALDKLVQSQNRDCVRPLLLQKGPVSLPAGLEDAPKVYWLKDRREKSEKALSLLIQECIDKDNQSPRKQPSVTPSAKTSMSNSSSSFGNKEGTTSIVNKTEDMDDLELLVKAAKSVGLIGKTGTGFRVGSKYIMTASHVIKRALKMGDIEEFGQHSLEDIQTQLDKQNLSIHFKFNRDAAPVRLGKIVFFKDTVKQKHIEKQDPLSDVSIVELKTTTGDKVPDHFPLFYDDYDEHMTKPKSEQLHFIGHDGGFDKQKHGSATTIIHGSMAEEMVEELKKKLPKAIKKNVLQRLGTDPKRVQLRGPFRHGGSGSPGVVIRHGKLMVHTMLTHGLFHDKDVPDELNIQEGPRMWYVMKLLQKDKKELCKDIFKDWDSKSEDGSPMEED